MKKSFLKYLILFFMLPLVVIGGSYLFRDRQFVFLLVCVTLISFLPFFLSFEKRSHREEKIVLLAVMVALSVVGRVLFFMLPSFKPVTAIVILTGMYLGAESGFLCGALSALLSNFFFGQGGFTVFQMLGWGMIGVFAGLLSVILKKNRPVLLLFAAFSGFLYSMIVDLWTVISIDNSLNLARYLTLLAAALPTTIIYVISNVLFMLALAGPIGRKLNRVIEKYEI